MPNRLWPLLILLLAIGLAVAFLISGGDSPPPTDPQPQGTVTVDDSGDSPPPDAARVQSPVVDPQEEEPEQRTAENTQEAPTTPDLLQLRITDTQALPVPAVELWWSESAGVRKQPPVAGNGQVALPDSSAQAVELVADGFLPRRIEGDELLRALQAGSLAATLDPAVQATGVVFHVRDPQGLPVPSIQLACHRRPLLASEGKAEVLLWERQAGDTDGEYSLPDLQPGHYRFAIQAIDGEALARPLLPYEHRLSYYGAEDVRTPVQLQPGALIRLTVQGAAGQALGNQVALRLEDAQGQVLETRWLAVFEEQRLMAIDTLPAPTACLLAAAIPPGRYTLRVQAEGRQADQPLELLADRITPVTIQP